MLNNYPIAKDWSEVTVEQFIELKSLTNIGLLSNQIERFCILSNIDQDDELFDNVDTDDIINEVSKLHFLNHFPTKITNTINEYKLININKITVGEFIDIDTYMSDNFYINIPKIAAILYRKYKLDDWGNEIIEPYSFDLNERSLIFEEFSINDIYGALERFRAFKTNVMTSYKSLFNDDSDDEDLSEEESKGLDDEEIKRINADIQKEKLRKRFAWSALVYNLANEDISKMKDVYNLPLIFCLNILIMKQNLAQ
jgi:hypothetical protein